MVMVMVMDDDDDESDVDDDGDGCDDDGDVIVDDVDDGDDSLYIVSNKEAGSDATAHPPAQIMFKARGLKCCACRCVARAFPRPGRASRCEA